MVYADLHTHTHYSDGRNAPRQNVYWAKLFGMDAIGITDHDTTFGLKQAVKEGRNLGITVVPGVEVTTYDYHVLGYNFDLQNKDLQNMLYEARQGQIDEVKTMTEILQNNGYEIYLQDTQFRFSGVEQRIGVLNLAETVLMSTKNEDKVIGKTLLEVYGDIRKLTSGVNKSRILPEQAVQVLKDAGAYVVFAHPPRDGTGVEDLQRMLDAGVDAFEIQPHYLGQPGKENPAFTYQVVIDFAKKHGVSLTAGSDYHGPPFVERPLLQKGQFDVEKFW